MTSPPAAPESETPLVKRLNCIDTGVPAWNEAIAEAATALSLAQTEIKGHMRVVDDLRAELREANEAAIRWYRAASPYATPVALREALDRLKDRA